MVSVSVALATYNGERFLRRQLETLARQTRLPDELVVTDDCSRDGTVEILREFAAAAPFAVRIEVNERSLNFRANFMKAAGLCRSDVIMFCDQDDVWRPEKIAVMAQAFADDPALALAYHNATVVDAAERPLAAMLDAAEQRAILACDLPPPWFFVRGLVQAFRRGLTRFDDLWPASLDHFATEPLGHDRWYILLALATGRVRFVDHDLLMYRQHGANAFGADADAAAGRLGRMFARWPHDASVDVLAAAGARSRAAALRAVEARIAPEQPPRLRPMIEAYEAHASRLDRRARTFLGPSPFARGASLLRSISRRDYRGYPWGFDGRSILRDAALGVIAGGGHR